MPSLQLCRDARTLLVGIVMLLSAAVAPAQTVMDPQKAEFDPSADHYAVSPDGTPVVLKYTLTIYSSGSTQPYETIDVGKPAPDADGKIRVYFVPMLSVPLQPGAVYLARVDAVGSVGSNSSADSNPFTFSSPCAPAISPTTASIPATGGTVNATVTVADGCSWTAASNNSWITIAAGQSGTGSGTAALSVAANPDGSTRSGSVTLATRLLTISQAPGPCSYTLTPTGQSFGAQGGSGSFAVGTGTSCTWTAMSNANWVTVAGSATGNGTVSFTVASNATLSTRSATVTVNGQAFAITQSGMTCTYTLAPTSQSLGADASGGSFSVTTPAGCPWNAVPGDSWLSIVTGSSGSGAGAVTFAAAANTSTSSRVSIIAVGGQTFTVSQAGSGCSFAVTPSGQAIPAGGGVALFDLSAPAGCTWTAVSSASWIGIASGASGSGSSTVTVDIAANSSTTSRNGQVSAGGKAFTVSQQGVSCSYSITPAGDFVAYSSASGTISVSTNAGCTWNVTTDVSWIMITSGLTGTGSASVTYSIAPNTTASVRTGTITIAGQTLTIKQRKAPASKRG